MSRIEKLLKAIINNTTYDEPRLSRIEEIFYSILYSLPYNADAQSRIEALLLALKESGLYDERTLSRIEEILKCKLDGRTYTGWIGSRVEMLLNEWELSEIIEATFTSFPIIIKANGQPLLDFLISGNMSQTGTSTPDSPIMPQECGELETNLAIISGDSKTIENKYYTDVRMTDVLEAGTYTISYVIDEKTGNASTSSVGFGTRYAYQKDFKSFTVSNVPTTITVTVTLDSEGCLWARFLRAGSPTDFSYSVSHVRVEKGSHSYGYKIPISSASTTTPVYLGEVESTRRIRKLVLTGEEFVYVYANADIAFRINTSDAMLNYRYCVCTHFSYQRTPGHSMIDGVTAGAGDYNLYFTFSSSSATQFGVVAGDTNSFKSFLQQQYANGTPVTVWYVLAIPTTGIVNEPLRKIGDYADTLSMEQAGVSIPTLNKPNNTIIDVETTLKPSETYVKYNGEGTRVYITADGKLYITSNNEIYILKR